MEWTWDSIHLDAFDAIKEELGKTPLLTYFNPKSEYVIQTGAVLLQEVRLVFYASLTLSRAFGALFQHLERTVRSGIHCGETAQLCVW